MSEQEKAAELIRLRDYLADLESGARPHSQGPEPPPYNERELLRVRARIAALEAELGI